MIRSLARNRAKVRMKALGMRKVCKKGHFANYWKDYGYGGKRA